MSVFRLDIFGSLSRADSPESVILLGSGEETEREDKDGIDRRKRRRAGV